MYVYGVPLMTAVTLEAAEGSVELGSFDSKALWFSLAYEHHIALFWAQKFQVKAPPAGCQAAGRDCSF
jgi:hypothetical protein